MKRILSSKNFILGLLVGMLIGLIGGWLESQVTVVTKSEILDCEVTSIESLPPSEDAYRVKEILEKKYSNND